uniref:PH domain-containing protein n=1 Tax=Haptolina brevifila TaxID=156173 RepID=A0A7S2CKN4_9EUKA|mmetsp:Transcript_26088/g.52312  ORF Transcript_26088/g.52312 Transcript_26088/m.52312 type:complete len:241 (+) Transcript_26088:2-724(+)
MQAAAVRALQVALSASQVEQQVAQKHADDSMQSAKDALAMRDARLEELQRSVREAHETHVRRLCEGGVVALKHGRKGKPHPRHVRCVRDRLEWSRPEYSRPDGKSYEKAILCGEIMTIRGGAATDVAKRLGKGRDEERILCVTATSRTLDLEFGSQAARDEWWELLRSWHEMQSALDMPAGWSSSLPHPHGHSALPLTSRLPPLCSPATVSIPRVSPPEGGRRIPIDFSPSALDMEEEVA